MKEASEGRRGRGGETDSEDEHEEKSRYSKVKIEIFWNGLERGDGVVEVGQGETRAFKSQTGSLAWVCRCFKHILPAFKFLTQSNLQNSQFFQKNIWFVWSYLNMT